MKSIASIALVVCSLVGLIGGGIPKTLSAPTTNAEEIVQETIQESSNPVAIIRTIAREKDIAPNDLLAISAQESSLGMAKTGDKGCSHGFFHINLCANPDAKGLIGDVESETTWVANRLIAYGYFTDRRTAIARYNSPNNPNYKYADLVDKRLPELPLFLKPYNLPSGE